MNRLSFLKTALGAALLPAAALAKPVTPVETAAEATRLRRELDQAWRASERTTLLTAGQMPAEHFAFRYTPGAMTFAEQWRHCCEFTVAQVTGRLGVKNPYEIRPLPALLTKAEALTELKAMYAFVRETIAEAPAETLLAEDAYMGETLPVWRILYALENHLIHHRGQCVVYLRLKGIAPEGYLGW